MLAQVSGLVLQSAAGTIGKQKDITLGLQEGTTRRHKLRPAKWPPLLQGYMPSSSSMQAQKQEIAGLGAQAAMAAATVAMG